MPQIVIVEDELIAAEYLKEVLQSNGFEVLDVIDTGKVALQEIPKLKPDIVLMDIMLRDGISGSEVALSLRQNAPQIAIIFLTAYADDEMVEYAKEANTYGYLMKPYNEKEIINTLKVIFARMKECKDNKISKSSELEILKIDDHLIYDNKLNKLFRDSTEIGLGTNAMKLMELLCSQPNTTVSNEQICLHVWDEIKTSATLRTQIHRIRTVLGDEVLQNVNGVGYMIKTL